MVYFYLYATLTMDLRVLRQTLTQIIKDHSLFLGIIFFARQQYFLLSAPPQDQENTSKYLSL